MRLQLTSRRAHRAFRWAGTTLALLAGLSASMHARTAKAQVAQVDTAHTLFHESPTKTNMTVYTPGVDVGVTPVDWMTVRGGYEADIVSGASVATKAGPAYQAVNPGVDVVSTASVRDVRHSPSGGITLRKGDVTYSAIYTYGTENDYRSHSVFVSARTEAYDHNTQFQLDYARNFDSVCDRVQDVNAAAPRFRALESSNGCFESDPVRTTRSLGI